MGVVTHVRWYDHVTKGHGFEVTWMTCVIRVICGDLRACVSLKMRRWYEVTWCVMLIGDAIFM